MFVLLPYARNYNLLLIRSRSWIQAIHKDRIFWKNLLKNKGMVFENGVKNIQAAAYNGARTVFWEAHKFLRNLQHRFVLCINVQNFVAFSEYMNFTYSTYYLRQI